MSSKQLQERILTLYQKNPKERYSAKQIKKKLKVSNSLDSISYALEQLVQSGSLRAVKDGIYKLQSYAGMQTYHGYVDMTRSGAAYVICDDYDKDIYVSRKRVNYALDGDEVEVLLREVKTNKAEGEIVKILQRSNDLFVGTYQQNDGFGFVVPDNERVQYDFFISSRNSQGANNGQKVIIKVIEWPENNPELKSPSAKVQSILDEMDPHELAMQSYLVNNGFQEEFSDKVLTAANKLGFDPESEKNNRRDFRKVTTFTIDPDTAKDFDDALSIKRLDNGEVEVGVHIADVTHFVTPDSVIDKEAFHRSTSVYLVDRVAPMLPEKLSNELCSLRPHEDSLTFSAVFTFDTSGKITSEWFGRSLIHSDHRFAYEEAQEVIDSDDINAPFKEEMMILYDLYKTLRKKRFDEGSIDFDSEELKIVLDENNHPIKIIPKERLDAHMLIEEFMLLANRKVAEYMHNKDQTNEIPFVYRVHDLPDEEKMSDFSIFLGEFGFKFHSESPSAIRGSINRLTREAEKDDVLRLIQPNAIRMMAKAIYTTDNIGHFGLGFEYYTHFTSPIRRYADVLVHRILYDNLDGKTRRYNISELESQCQHISNQERKAQNAERDSIKYKQVEFMLDQVGKEFEGIISGMIDKGLFVKIIENGCEGLVAFPIQGEDFKVSENRLQATGKISQEVWHLGEKVKVIVHEVNLDAVQIEMEILEKITSSN